MPYVSCYIDIVVSVYIAIQVYMGFNHSTELT